MYTNKATINTTATANSGIVLLPNRYMSSTEEDENTNWGQVFGNGVQSAISKSQEKAVRAVRAF